MPISNGKTLYVGGTGEGNYTKIQDAVDNASIGDTVYVYKGIYYERVKINKTITFLGENRDNTIIDAGGKSCPVKLEAHNIYVSGFTLQNSGNYYEEHAGIGIRIQFLETESDYNTIIGNRFTNNCNGILAIYSDGNKITDNIIINNRNSGIFLETGCEFNIIENNDIKDNEVDGIRFDDSDYNRVLKNTIKNNVVSGILLYDSDDNEIYENIIMNGDFGIHLLGLTVRNEIYKNTIAFCNDTGVFLQYASINEIKQNSFMNNKCHCSFEIYLWEFVMYNLLKPLLIIYRLINPLQQYNIFSRNYWDDHPYTKPKKIEGKMIFFYMLSDLLYWTDFEILQKIFYPRTVEWSNYDWFPARVPYDIGV